MSVVGADRNGDLPRPSWWPPQAGDVGVYTEPPAPGALSYTVTWDAEALNWRPLDGAPDPSVYPGGVRLLVRSNRPYDS